MHYLFTYGTLQEPKVQLKLYGRHLEGIHDILPNYTVEFIQGDTKIVPRAVPAPDAELQGTVYQISESELKNTDIYEGAEYVRVRKTLKSGREVWVYARF